MEKWGDVVGLGGVGDFSNLVHYKNGGLLWSKHETQTKTRNPFESNYTLKYLL